MKKISKIPISLIRTPFSAICNPDITGMQLHCKQELLIY